MTCRRPKLGIKIEPPSMSGKVYLRPDQHDTLRCQPALLLQESAGSRSESQAAIGTQDPMPRQLFGVARITKHTADQTCATRQSGARSNFAVAGDASRRNTANNLDDGLLSLRSAGLHDRHCWGTLAHTHVPSGERCAKL